MLRGWNVPVRQIGLDLGRKGMADEEILPFLLTLSRPTFFTRDLGLANRTLCHGGEAGVLQELAEGESHGFAILDLRFAIGRQTITVVSKPKEGL
jgi:hypothetical protein